MIALKSNDFPVPVSATTVNVSNRVSQRTHGPDCDEHETRTCRSRKEHALPFFHDKLKHPALLLAEVRDGRRLVSATSGAERDARGEEGIDFRLFGCMTESIGVGKVARLALLGVAEGWLE